MKSLVLAGLGNDASNRRSFFVLEKANKFREIFNEILEKLKLEDSIPIEQSPIIELENQISHYKNNEFDIDVVYTRDRIVIIVRAGQSNLERFKSLILAYSKMEE